MFVFRVTSDAASSARPRARAFEVPKTSGKPVQKLQIQQAATEPCIAGESKVDLSTHQLFNIQPTTFLEFAQRNAAAFGAAA
jgi:hypothetical protein